MFPEMEVWTHFVTHIYQRALKIDALKFSHPIEVQVASVAEIEESVDEICLKKAPALLRMVHRFIGDGDFRQGLKLYLERYRFGNATTADFWKCLQEASSKPVVSVMSSWTQFKGYVFNYNSLIYFLCSFNMLSTTVVEQLVLDIRL